MVKLCREDSVTLFPKTKKYWSHQSGMWFHNPSYRMCLHKPSVCPLHKGKFGNGPVDPLTQKLLDFDKDFKKFATRAKGVTISKRVLRFY